MIPAVESVAVQTALPATSAPVVESNDAAIDELLHPVVAEAAIVQTVVDPALITTEESAILLRASEAASEAVNFKVPLPTVIEERIGALGAANWP